MPLPDWFHEAAAWVNNWGRWGDDDELGTLNLITPEVVKRAAGASAPVARSRWRGRFRSTRTSRRATCPAARCCAP